MRSWTVCKSFCVEDSGAVTVDWTLLTAAVVGLGMAGSAAVIMGADDISHDISNQTSGQSVLTEFNSTYQNVSFFDDFEDGQALGWSVAQTDNTEASLGGILGRFGGTGGAQMVHKTWALDPNASFAVIEFDLHAIDTWDLEAMSIFLNDALASQRTFSTHDGDFERQQVIDSSPSNVAITYGAHSSAENGYSVRGDVKSHDETVAVRIEVSDPGSSLKLGFGSTLDQSIGDESWAIDNMRVTSTNDPESV